MAQRELNAETIVTLMEEDPREALRIVRENYVAACEAAKRARELQGTIFSLVMRTSGSRTVAEWMGMEKKQVEAIVDGRD